MGITRRGGRWLLLAGLILRAATAAAALGVGDAAPEVTAQQWLNTAPLTLAALRDKVTLVEFWTFACWNCQHVEPQLKRWHEQYAQRGLVIVAVHTPELEQERDPANVAAYVREHGIRYPVAIDPSFATWDRYENRAWPALYLIDKRGVLRHVHVGEGGYAETEAQIERLLEQH